MTDIIGLKRVGKTVELTWQNAPANLFDMTFTLALRKVFDDLEEDKSVEAVIVRSSLRLFSGGVDLSNFYKSTEAKFKRFWGEFQMLFQRIYTSRLVVVFAINAHNYAGGCILALAADYRIMVNNPKLRMGLNEIVVGLPVPIWLSMAQSRLIGAHNCEMLTQKGAVSSPQELLDVGMLDQLVGGVDELLPAAHAFIAPYLKVPNPWARSQTKRWQRKEIGDFMLANNEALCDELWQGCNTPRTQAVLGHVIASLSKGKSKKPSAKL